MLLSVPITDTFDARLLEYVDCLECRDHTLDTELPRQWLYHSSAEINWKMDFRPFKHIKQRFKVVSFHCAFNYGSRTDMLKMAKHNIENLKRVFDCPIAIENNNWLNSTNDIVTDADFLSKLIYDNDVYLLYDKAHAEITMQNRGLESYDLPFDRMIQVHLSRPVDGQDAHELPEIEPFDAEYLTIEYYKDNDKLIERLKEWRTLSQK